MRVDFRHVVAHKNNNRLILSIITRENRRKCYPCLTRFFFTFNGEMTCLFRYKCCGHYIYYNKQMVYAADTRLMFFKNNLKNNQNYK